MKDFIQVGSSADPVLISKTSIASVSRERDQTVIVTKERNWFNDDTYGHKTFYVKQSVQEVIDIIQSGQD